MVELDLFVLTPVAAAFVGMTVAFISIWSNIKSTRHKAKAALEKNTADIKAELKEYIGLKLAAMDTKVDTIKEEMRHAQTLESRANDNRVFFTAWNQRLEDKIDKLLPLPIKILDQEQQPKEEEDEKPQ